LEDQQFDTFGITNIERRVFIQRGPLQLIDMR